MRVLAEKRELEFAGRAVALLPDDDVGDALARRVGLVDFLAINEDDQICYPAL